MTGDEGAFELRDDGVLETEDAGPRIGTVAQRSEQVVPDFVLDGPLHVAGGAELADRGGARCG